MSKEKELLKSILANTNAIMAHLKISSPVQTKKVVEKKVKPSPKAKAAKKKV